MRVPSARAPDRDPRSPPGPRPAPAWPSLASDLLSTPRRSLGAAGSCSRPSPARCHLRPWKLQAGRSRVSQRAAPPTAQASASARAVRAAPGAPSSAARAPTSPAPAPALAPPGGRPGPARLATSEGQRSQNATGETEARGPAPAAARRHSSSSLCLTQSYVQPQLAVPPLLLFPHPRHHPPT